MDFGHTRPRITDDPDDQTICANGTAIFSVTATGYLPLTYQWYKVPGILLVEGGRFTGTNLPSLNISNIVPGDAGNYYCIVTDGHAKTVQCSSAALTVIPQPLGPTLDLKTPNLAGVCDGQAVSATFTAGSGGVGCSDAYQYRFDGAGAWNAYTPGNNINTTGHTQVEIQGQRSGCQAGAGCSGTLWVTLATWTVNSQPVGPALNIKTPDLAAVCDGQAVSATFTAGSGGVGCSDTYQYRFDGAGAWNVYTPGNNINTTGHTQVEIQGQRSGCQAGAGCSGTLWVTLATWTVNSQPVGPTLNIKTPDLASVCDGQAVSATFTAGSGGVGCSDAYQYRFDGAGAWNAYTPGNNINTTGHTQVEIQGQRSGCQAGAGCSGTSWVTLATWTVNSQPVGPALNIKTPDLVAVCDGQAVSATFTAGSGGVGCSDAYQYRFDGAGAWNAYTPGNNINTTGHTQVEIQGQRSGCQAGAGCSGTLWVTLATWTVNSQPVGPVLNIKTPDLAAVCDGQAVSATFTAGSGGVGCSDAYQYRFDGAGAWNAYTPGNNINTTGHTQVEIQGQRSGCQAGAGCSGTSWVTLATWTVNSQPVGPVLNIKTPDLVAVCDGQAVSATFTAGSGGVGCSDAYQYRFDGAGAWNAYTPGNNINTTGHTQVEIQGQRSGCQAGAGCSGTLWVTLATWTVNSQPVGPTLNLKTPDLASVCDGQAVSATFTAGSGGVGCSDAYQYRFDGAGAWNAYTPGNNINTTGHTQVEIQGQRSGCQAGAGCSGTLWVTLATWTVNSQPVGPALNIKTPDLAAVCDGQAVSATFTAGSGGVGCSDTYQYRFDGAGAWNVYTPGNNINTTGHTQVEIQGQRSGCQAGAGCSGTLWVTLATWTVNSQPVGPALNIKTPDLAAVCDGQAVSATFTAGSGGVGCSDTYQYRFDGAGAWNVYTPGNNINTTGHTQVEIQGQRSGCQAGAGCSGTLWVTLATWTVNSQPVGPTLNLKTPDLASVCDGQAVSATFTAGSGGVGCSDAYQYRFDGAGAWNAYTPGNNINTTGHTQVEIQGQRSGCQAGAGCSGTLWVTLATWTVNSQPVGPALNIKTPDLAAVCDGQAVSATFTAGSGGVGCSDTYQYRFDGAGAWNVYTPGNNINTTGHTQVEIQGQRSGCQAGAGCSGTLWVTLATWTVNSQPVGPTLNLKTPDLASVCDGQAVSATFTAGSGGVGCSDAYQYRFDGAGAWNVYTPGNNINTTGHTQVEIQGQRSGCQAGAGCSGTPWLTLSSWTVVPDPLAPVIVRDPSDNIVCEGASLTISVTTPGSGGTGVSTDEYRYSTDNGTAWSLWNTTQPNFPAVTGTNIVEARRNSTGPGCTSNVNQVSWTVVADPVPPLIAKSPSDATVCEGTTLTISVTTPGSGGTGTSTDEYMYSTNNGVDWSLWSPVVPDLTAVTGITLIRSRRNSSGTGCDSFVNQVSWAVVPDPVAPVISKNPSDATVCTGAALTITVTTPGSGGTGANNDQYRYSTDNGSSWSPWGTTIPNFPAVNGTNLIESRRNSTGTGCISNVNQVSWTVTSQPSWDTYSFPTTIICNGGEVLFSATVQGGLGGSLTWIRSVNPGGAGVTVTSPDNPPVAGTYYYRPQYAASGAGCSLSDGTETTVTVQVDPVWNVISSPVENICIGESLVFSATLNNGGTGTVQWIRSATAGGPGIVVASPDTPVATGTYYYRPEYLPGYEGCNLANGTETQVTVHVDPGWNIIMAPSSGICIGESVSFSATLNNDGTGTVQWIRSATSGGAGVTVTSPDEPPATGIYYYRPRYVPGYGGCDLADGTETVVTVYPYPVLTSTPTPPAICSGSSFSYIPASSEPGTDFSWSRVPVAGISPAGPTSGSGNPNETLTNSTVSPLTVRYVYTLTANGCTNASAFNVDLVVNPTAAVNQPTNKVVCNGAASSVINFTTTNTGGTVTYTWTNDQPSIGLAAAGSGDIASFTATNAGTAPVVATITVTPHFENASVTCDGPPKTFTITVNPTAAVNLPSAQVVCNGAAITNVNFTTTNTGGTVTYTWTNDQPSIGLAAAGAGDISSFTATNAGTAPVVATITVTPHFENGSVTCDGPPQTFTITVNPTAEVDQPTDQVVCNGAAVADVNFTTTNTGGTVTYTWTNDQPSIGLAAAGSGDIASFTATNAGTAPVVATITVTPHFENGSVTCDGPPKTFTITVNPTAEVDQPSDQVVCNGSASSVVNFTTTNTGGTVTYTWTNDQPSIGLAAAGTGDIASFTATNAGTAPVVATIIVTPHFENGSVTCDGPPKTFTITVNPTAQVNLPSDVVVCNGSPASVVFGTVNTGGTTTYTWTNDQPPIGLAATGNGDITSFTATNAGTAPVVATIVVTPHFENGSVTCDGPPKTFTITVNPTAEVDQPADQVVCNGAAAAVVNFTTTNTGGTVTYTWTNDQPSIGLAAAGSGDIASFTATNAGTAPVVATIIVTPHFENGSVTCDGPPKTFTITVNPTAQVNLPSDVVVCNGSPASVVFGTLNTGGTTTYTWTNDQPSIGLAAAGAGDIASFTATNAGTAPVVATIIVTPHFENGSVTCDGPPKTFTITVNPTAEVDQPTDQVVCNGAAACSCQLYNHEYRWYGNLYLDQ